VSEQYKIIGDICFHMSHNRSEMTTDIEISNIEVQDFSSNLIIHSLSLSLSPALSFFLCLYVDSSAYRPNLKCLVFIACLYFLYYRFLFLSVFTCIVLSISCFWSFGEYLRSLLLYVHSPSRRQQIMSIYKRY
jgi:hypothetical protein